MVVLFTEIVLDIADAEDDIVVLMHEEVVL